MISGFENLIPEKQQKLAAKYGFGLKNYKILAIPILVDGNKLILLIADV